ncbi:GlxA family transcriptional regulator [Lacibacterium aquatile]|uniref:GlxA family transcriptional regulator n=1 Tax=Lacibacterium aquatile TaxID=1168082 RepID=A0ABW5DPG2_9PROT
MTRLIEILAIPGFQLLDLTGPLQVFASANELAKQETSDPYRIGTVSRSGGPVVSSSGLTVMTSPLSDPASPLHTLIVPGGQGIEAAMADALLIEWIAARSASAQRVVSICTGAFIVAASGRFDGRRVATHWERCDDLARRFPALTVEPHPIFIEDGSCWSSAGVTAGIDLCLALVERDLGRDLALAIARDLVVYLKRPGGQSQYSAMLSLQRSSRFVDLHDWMLKTLAGDLSLGALAQKAGMSERSFSRRYLEETGITPARAVERLRIEAARTLLADTPLPVKTVAKQCGFQNEETLRRSFTRLLATSPQDYRRNWQADEQHAIEA